MNRANTPIIVALDYPALTPALNFVDQLDPTLCHLKVGSELFTHCGPSIIEILRLRGFLVFLDLKFHDIPHTVAAACAAAADLGVWMLTLHIAGGLRMLDAAREILQRVQQPPLLIGVTLLTSLEQNDLISLGYAGSLPERVLALAQMGEKASLDGIVCSAQEVAAVRALLGSKYLLITPGIRLLGTHVDDQRRVMTPRKALDSGADYLVIGRSITQAHDPKAVLLEIIHSCV